MEEKKPEKELFNTLENLFNKAKRIRKRKLVLFAPGKKDPDEALDAAIEATEKLYDHVLKRMELKGDKSTETEEFWLGLLGILGSRLLDIPEDVDEIKRKLKEKYGEDPKGQDYETELVVKRDQTNPPFYFFHGKIDGGKRSLPFSGVLFLSKPYVEEREGFVEPKRREEEARAVLRTDLGYHLIKEWLKREGKIVQVKDTEYQTPEPSKKTSIEIRKVGNKIEVKVRQKLQIEGDVELEGRNYFNKVEKLLSEHAEQLLKQLGIQGLYFSLEEEKQPGSTYTSEKGEMFQRIFREQKKENHLLLNEQPDERHMAFSELMEKVLELLHRGREREAKRLLEERSKEFLH